MLRPHSTSDSRTWLTARRRTDRNASRIRNITRTLATAAVVTSVVSLAVVSLSGPVAASAPAPHSSTATDTSKRLWPADSSWQRYVLAPKSNISRPVRVMKATGAVDNPDGLLEPGGRPTTLTYKRGTAAPTIVVDYGRETGGLPFFDLISSSGAPTLRSAYAEALRLLTKNGDGNVSSAGLFQGGNGNRYDTFGTSASGVVRSQYIAGGERYELITLDTPGTVKIASAGIKTTFERGTAKTLRGHFVSSDPLLNRIWYQSVYTLNLDQVPPGVTGGFPGESNPDHLILDGAKRDRAVWSGDLGIAGLANLYSGNPAYLKDSLALIATHPASSASQLMPAVGTMTQPGPFPGVCSPSKTPDLCLSWSASYSLVLVSNVYQYYLYTGDKTFLARTWPALVRDLAWAAQQVDAKGLFNVSPSALGANDATDWNVEQIGGALTYDNALYYMALTDAAKIQAVLGSNAPANAGCPSIAALVACTQDYTAQAAKVRSAVNAALWNPKTGVYDASTTQRNNYVQDANVFAVLSGIASPARAGKVMKRLDAKLVSPYGAYNVASPVPTGYDQVTSPFMSGFNLLADLHAGHTKAALSLMRKEWGWMLSQDPHTTAWERIEMGGQLTATGEGGTYSTSGAHAWSSGPAPALSSAVLGVTPQTPGFTRFTVRPQTGGLRWAQGRVPTPAGAISVKWGTAGRPAHPTAFTMRAAVPAHTTATIAVPLFGTTRVIRRSGTAVWNGHHAVHGAHATRHGGYVYITGVHGTHLWSWS